MSRTLLMENMSRALRLARFCEERGLSTSDGLAQAAELEARRRVSRRRFLGTMAGLAAAAALPRTAQAGRRAKGGAAPSVAIVGAGLAGLSCAYELKKAGIEATVYEASGRAGGRCFSMGGAFPGPVTFPGQVVERGGEFIDNLHKSMIGYAREFGLTLEDVSKEPGEVFYYFDGRRHPESAVVDEYRALVAAMRADLRTLSPQPSADSHTPADEALDRMDLATYLDSRGAGPIIKKAIIAAYIAEYGLEAAQQSCLNFLLFIHADRRSKFTPFGVFSDERFHVVSGNEGIVAGLRDRVAGQLRYGHRLLRLRRLADGRLELTLAEGRRTRIAAHDVVVAAIPFTVLRQVELDGSLGLPPWKLRAIHELGYGTNAKMMVGFNGPFWSALGSNGASYSDLANHQATWETNPARATSGSAVLTDYSSGTRGARLDPARAQEEAARFLGDLERVFPGAQAAAARDGTRLRAHLEHWPSNPLTLGSYTCYLPGQFTTIAGNEGKAVGNLLFAGEHADSFYSWQGFMEGAVLSGLKAASDILDAIRSRPDRDAGEPNGTAAGPIPRPQRRPTPADPLVQALHLPACVSSPG